MARNERPRVGATKGDRTRAFIVEQAAEAYNVHGYAGLSISDVLARTNLEKGGLYNHFKSKDELALAAFDLLASRAIGRVEDAMTQAGPSAARRLFAMIDVYRTIGEKPFLPGGCPILNTATEADDTHPALRARARAAMAHWHELVRVAIATGVASGEFATRAQPADAATVVIAALEGGVLMSKLYRDSAYLRSIAAFLHDYVESLRAPGAGDARG